MLTQDSFFGETEKERMPMSLELTRRWEQWVAGGAICSEMESATLFILSSIYRKRAGSVNVMVAKDEHLPNDAASKALFNGDRAIRIAVEGLKKLIESDRKAAKEAEETYLIAAPAAKRQRNLNA